MTIRKQNNFNLYREMTKEEFIGAIDASFSFDTDAKYEEATLIACSISDNSVLMVGYELASLSSRAPLEVNLRLLQLITLHRPSPVVLAALPVIESLLKHKKPSASAVSNLLEKCKDHGSAWNGLGIVECANESLETFCDKIRENYMKKLEKGK